MVTIGHILKEKATIIMHKFKYYCPPFLELPLEIRRRILKIV